MKRILAAVCLLIATQLPASAAEERTTPVLAGRTTVIGSEVASQIVELPRPVEVSGDVWRNPLFDIESHGRLAGVVLRQQIEEDPIEVMGFRAALCDEPPCKEKPITWTDVVDTKSKRLRPKKVTLPSGLYALYVIAGDGQETRVEIDLPGLGGSTVLRPSGPARSTLGPMNEEVSESNTKAMYRGSAKQVIDGLGIAMAGIELENEALVYEDIDTCLVREDEAGDDALSGSISCNGSGAGWFGVGRAGRSRTVIIAYDLVDSGSFTNSVSYRSIGRVDGFSTLDFSLSTGEGDRSIGRSSGIFHWED